MRGKSFKHTLRLLQKGNKCGDVIGITIPRELIINNKKIEELIGVKFTISTSGNNIILTSGCNAQPIKDKDLKDIMSDSKRLKI